MKRFLLMVIAFLTLSLFACNKKNVKTAKPPQQESVQKIEDVVSTNEPAVEEANIRDTEFLSSSDIKAVYFDFDKYDISADMAGVLSENAKVIKEKKWTVLVEGHCDNRGTIEYNLALGQKRANTVKNYYIKLGVPETSIGTISYGEESPVCTENTEACWAKNRRAETKVSR